MKCEIYRVNNDGGEAVSRATSKYHKISEI